MKNRKTVLFFVVCAFLLLIQCTPAQARKHHRNSDKQEADETIFTNSQNIDAAYSDWMADNRDVLKNLPINKVPLLGSHDAGSCDVNRDSPPCAGYLTHSGHHIHRMPRGLDVTSARCQSASIEDQLRYGVRYLDLRIARQDNAYWIEHMWLSTPLSGEGGVFAQIKDFVRKHPQEIIILNMKELYSEKGEMTLQEADAYFQLVETEFGAMLAPAGDFAKTTIGSLWAQGARLVVIGDTRRTTRPFVWNESEVDDKWMNKQDPGELYDALDVQVVSPWRDGKCAGKLRILQAMTTTKHKILAAGQTNPRIKERLKSGWRDAPINVVQVDDSVNSGLMQVLIERLK
jgi:hypothetical protein